MSQFFLIFGVTEVFEVVRLLHTILFSTDFVFFALCGCFDDSMVLFDEFLPYKSWNTVDIIQKQNTNLFDTTLIVVVYFSYTNISHKGFVEFCVVEVLKFWVKIRWTME